MQMAGAQLLIYHLAIEEKVTSDSLTASSHSGKAGTVTFITKTQL